MNPATNAITSEIPTASDISTYFSRTRRGDWNLKKLRVVQDTPFEKMVKYLEYISVQGMICLLHVVVEDAYCDKLKKQNVAKLV